MATISSGLCFFWGIPASSKWLESHTSGRTTFQGAGQQGENLDAVYGMRRKYDHNYPHYFPQSLSNPQEVFCYPDEALAEFRKWLREEYVPNKMPSYLANKIKDGTLPQPAAVKVLDAFKGKSIPRVR